ncbi:MAG: hypothetical protein R6X02_14070 [Enhygromyxa sp.]
MQVDPNGVFVSLCSSFPPQAVEVQLEVGESLAKVEGIEPSGSG